MKTIKLIVGILTLFCVTPIWFYILYKILSAINATELTWFLYWAYVPIALFTSFLVKISEDYE